MLYHYLHLITWLWQRLEPMTVPVFVHKTDLLLASTPGLPSTLQEETGV